MTLVQLGSALVRAYRPRSETDLPFLLALAALLVIGLLPPASTTLNGPLCGRPTLFAAGERLLRALLFASIYVIHTYCAAPRRDALKDLAVCVVRCAAASIWILGCHPVLLCFAVVQGAFALWARFGAEEFAAPGGGGYHAVDGASDGERDGDGDHGDLDTGGGHGGGGRASRDYDAPLSDHDLSAIGAFGAPNGIDMPPPATETNGLTMGWAPSACRPSARRRRRPRCWRRRLSPCAAAAPPAPAPPPPWRRRASADSNGAGDGADVGADPPYPRIRRRHRRRGLRAARTGRDERPRGRAQALAAPRRRAAAASSRARRRCPSTHATWRR